MTLRYPFIATPSITLYPDGEVRLKNVIHRRDRRTKKNSGDSPIGHLARRIKSHKTLKELLQKSLSKAKEFTPYGRNTLRRSASAIESICGREKCNFLTLTCPGSSYRARRAYARWASYLSRRLRLWIRHNFEFMGEAVPLIGVNELQKRGALHQHYLTVTPDGETLESFKAKVQDWYGSVLEYLCESEHVDLFQKHSGFTWRNKWDEIKNVACDIQQVKKSVGAYLSKYMSKKDGKGGLIDPNLTPDRWWYMNQAARQMMESRTIRIPLGQLTRQEMSEVNDLAATYLQDVAKKVNPLINPYTQDWIGVVAYGTRDVMKTAMQEISSAIVKAYEVVDGNRKAYLELVSEENHRLNRQVDEEMFVRCGYWWAGLGWQVLQRNTS